MNLDLDHLRQWIGREDHSEEYASEGLVSRFNATLNRSETVRDGDTAPQLIHFCIAPAAAPTSELGEDGHPARGGFLPPVPLPRRMWAGGSLRFIAPITIGAKVSRHSTIRDVVVKEGRSGTLCFVTVDHKIECNGTPAISERQDIVYRDAEKPALDTQPKRTAPPAPEGTWRETLESSAPLLFRYSALTFNGHRIHYDLPYARDVEGYPGLIVHGPLQATLLVLFAGKLKGKPPTAFEFRSLSPLFDNAALTLNAREEADGLLLWTSRPDGPVAMEAKASW
jgi:3-methylfumaryl-CoA hydratase